MKVQELTKSSVNNGSTNPFTREEDDFIRANINVMTFAEMADEMNNRFHRNRTEKSVYLRNYNYLKIKKNVGVPVGSEHFDGVHWWVKVKEEFVRTGRHSYRECWIYKHKKVWEEANGPIPEDGVIIFLDGDGGNCNLENLYCVSKKINAMMSRYKWHFENVEMKKAAIKWCELYYALKGGAK